MMKKWPLKCLLLESWKAKKRTCNKESLVKWSSLRANIESSDQPGSIWERHKYSSSSPFFFRTFENIVRRYCHHHSCIKSYFCQHSVEISAELDPITQLLYPRPLRHRCATCRSSSFKWWLEKVKVSCGQWKRKWLVSSESLKGKWNL